MSSESEISERSEILKRLESKILEKSESEILERLDILPLTPQPCASTRLP